MLSDTLVLPFQMEMQVTICITSNMRGKNKMNL